MYHHVQTVENVSMKFLPQRPTIRFTVLCSLIRSTICGRGRGKGSEVGI